MKEKKVVLVATNIAPYGKGYQINAFVNGVETEATYYGVSKKYALTQAKAAIETYGKLAFAPYKSADAIFTEVKRKKILAQFAKEVA